MEAPGPLVPWFALFSGAAAVVAGGYVLARPAGFGAALRALGGREGGTAERIGVALALLAAGGGWLFVCWAESHPFAGGARPLWVVATVTALLPLSPLLCAGVLAWLLVLRRTAAPRGR